MKNEKTKSYCNATDAAIQAGEFAMKKLKQERLEMERLAKILKIDLKKY